MRIFNDFPHGEHADRTTTWVPLGRGARTPIEQYEELLHIASPGAIEQIHFEAFARLAPDERDAMFAAFAARAPALEDLPLDASPAGLAQIATKIELDDPGAALQLFKGREVGFGVASGLLATFVGYAVGCELSLFYLTTSSLGPDSPEGQPEYFWSDASDGLPF